MHRRFTLALVAAALASTTASAADIEVPASMSKLTAEEVTQHCSQQVAMLAHEAYLGRVQAETRDLEGFVQLSFALVDVWAKQDKSQDATPAVATASKLSSGARPLR